MLLGTLHALNEFINHFACVHMHSIYYGDVASYVSTNHLSKGSATLRCCALASGSRATPLAIRSPLRSTSEISSGRHRRGWNLSEELHFFRPEFRIGDAVPKNRRFCVAQPSSAVLKSFPRPAA